MVRSNLPPLVAARAFEAAARHGSFTHAGTELGLTQAAVSYQIKVLEERVGHALFYRKPRGVELTQVGAALAQKFGDALDLIADAFAEAQDISQGTLALSVIPTFATNFLAQRLGRFQIAHPRIAVRLEVNEALADFHAEGFDVAIRSGSGEWPGLVSRKLVEIEFTPMLSPELADSVGGLSEPEDLLKLPILAGADAWWRSWLSTAGLNEDGLAGLPKQTFGPQVFEAAAAMAGQGIALLTPAFFQDELNSGRLLQPFKLCCRDGTAYWLTYPTAFRTAPKINVFHSWLLQELEEFAAAKT